MITESIEHARAARSRVDAALSELGEGRASSAAPELAGAVEELCAALAELAWAECDRACYGDEDEVSDGGH